MGCQDLRVSWLPGLQENAVESKTEDKGDVVLRLLLGHPNPGREVDMQCLPRPQTKGIPKDHFIDFRRQLKSLSWRDKLQTWQRLVTPINDIPEASPVPLDLVGSASLPEYHPDKFGSRNVTTATFGHIIHNSSHVGNLKETKKSKKKAKSPNAYSDDLIIPLHIDNSSTPGIDGSPKKSIPGAVLSHKRRTFYPLIPHPASFSALKPEGSDTLTQSTTIILNLAVHGDRSASNRQGPAIQVHLPVDAEADLANFSIPKDAAAYCVIPWYRNDLLLPGESVDVRLQHERQLALDMDATGLRSFLDTSEFNLLQGHLRTPSKATLVLPPEYVNPGTPGVKAKTQTYAFRGLEIHQTIEMPWREHTLRYSSIEAGQHGGQRQELALQAGKSDDPGTSFAGNKRKSFLQLVEDMATGQCFSWTEGYQSIKSRQLEDHSYDLPEEELTEDIIVDDGKFNTQGHSNFQRYEKPRQPRKEYTSRRGARDAPPRSKKFDDLEEMEQFGEADESRVTEPKVKEPEAKESEVDQTSTSKPDSTASEAREAGLDQASVDKSDVAAEETKEPKVDQASAKKPQKGQKGAKFKSPTELLHSFLDQFADPISLTSPMSMKPPTGQPGGDRTDHEAALENKVFLKEVVDRYNARQEQETLALLEQESRPQPQQDSRVGQPQEDSTARQAQKQPTARQPEVRQPEVRQPQEKSVPSAQESVRLEYEAALTNQARLKEEVDRHNARQEQETLELLERKFRPPPEEYAKFLQAKKQRAARQPEVRQPQEKSVPPAQESARQPQQDSRVRQAQEKPQPRQAQEKPQPRQPQEMSEARQPQEKSVPPAQENARRPQQGSSVLQAQEKPAVRQAQEKPEARQVQQKPAVRQATSEADFEAKFSARVSDKPLKAPPPVRKSKKITIKSNKKAKKQKETPQSAQSKDSFAAAFTSRLSTTHQHATMDSFFDNLPKPKKERSQYVKMAIKKATREKLKTVKKDRWQGRGRVKGKRR